MEKHPRRGRIEPPAYTDKSHGVFNLRSRGAGALLPNAPDRYHQNHLRGSRRQHPPNLPPSAHRHHQGDTCAKPEDRPLLGPRPPPRNQGQHEYPGMQCQMIPEDPGSPFLHQTPQRLEFIDLVMQAREERIRRQKPLRPSDRDEDHRRKRQSQRQTQSHPEMRAQPCRLITHPLHHERDSLASSKPGKDVNRMIDLQSHPHAVRKILDQIKHPRRRRPHATP